MAYIKNIVKVEFTEADNLKGIATPALHLCLISPDVSFSKINTKSPSSCEITDKVESKVRIFTSKLVFKSCEQIGESGVPLAFRVTTADGCRYLVGRGCRPYPVLTRTENMPGSFTETSLITYTVTWSDVVKPLLIIE